MINRSALLLYPRPCRKETENCFGACAYCIAVKMSLRFFVLVRYVFGTATSGPQVNTHAERLLCAGVSTVAAYYTCSGDLNHTLGRSTSSAALPAT